MQERVVLIILDGWGISPNPAVSAIDHARKPYFDSLKARYINAALNTTGLAVGLPPGQMGNSEVGHMNIGAGRVVYQELVRINEAIRTRELAENPAMLGIVKYLKANPSARLHLMGLVSDGGVHSHIDHLKGLMGFFHAHSISNTAIHAFTDGRDCAPDSGLGFVTEIARMAPDFGCHLATIIGRYYAMDRDKRWERVRLAYDAIVHGLGHAATDPELAIRTSYEDKVTDEFIKPIIMKNAEGNPVATLKNGDAVLFFNFRTDRGRELTYVLSQQAIPELAMHPLSLHYTTLTRYDETFQNVGVVFEKDNLENTLGQVIAQAGKRQIRIAETEKYPHVTFFFNGGREEAFVGEERIMCPSPKVATYDLKPEMSAFDIAEAITKRLKTREPDFVCLNFANTDMVGHTGVFAAAVAATEAVDKCLEQVVETALANGYTCWVIADHGNSDNMVNPDGSINTQHSTNPVPSILVGTGFEMESGRTIRDGKLGDLAPSILSLMGIPAPPEMTGEVLVGNL